MQDETTSIDIACPTCRKVVSAPLPPPSDLACPRCQCGLHILATIRMESAYFLRAARTALAQGDHSTALDAASTSWDLLHTRAAASIAFIAATLLSDTLEGIAWLRAARSL